MCNLLINLCKNKITEKMVSTLKLIISTLVSLILIAQTSFGQVTDVKYLLKYNYSEDVFDCYLVIDNGQAVTVPQRTQASAQISLVVPAGTKFHFAERYMPLVQNQNYNSNIPCQWDTNVILLANANCPGYDYYSINPSLSPSSQYNNLTAGDTVKLFSLGIDTLKGCATEIRLFENDLDIDSNHPCAQGIDFRNGFTMGGFTQLYRGNIIPVNENYAGDDEPVCRNTNILLDGNTLENATWRLLSGHLGDVTLDSLNTLQSEASFLQNARGTYNFSFGNDQISDFKCVTINVPFILSTDSIIMCPGFISQINPIQTGLWESSNPSVVNINNTGLATGISSGISIITYTEPSSGCISDEIPFRVNPRPIITLTGPDKICVGGTTTFIPNTGGTWVSNNPVSFPISNAGIVTGVLPGKGNFVFTSTSSGCSSLPSTDIIVNIKPTVTLTGHDEICIGGTTTFIPNTGGTWDSTNPALATITNAGIVTGVSAGTVTFIFTGTFPGCVSNPSESITVHNNPTASISGADAICTGGSTLWIASGGVSYIWTTTLTTPDHYVSTAGIYTVTVTDISGCTASASKELFVHPPPNVQFVGPNTICIGDTSQVAPGMAGIWSSLNPTIATITNRGKVQGIKDGTAQLVFTSTPTGCSSSPLSLTVLASPVASVSKEIVEINKSVTLSPNTGGNWYTSDTDIINIFANSFARGIGVGEATLYFQDSITGCISKGIKLNVIEPIFTILGYTFVDTNGNGLFDSQTDSPLPNCAIFIPELNTTFYTDKTGYYNIPVDQETYTATFTVPYGEWVQNTVQKTIVVNNTIEYLFAGFQPTNQGPGGLVTINSSFLKCNSLVDLDVSVLNNTSQKQSGYLAITIDEKTFVSESSPFPTGSDGNTLFWEYLDLLPGHTFTPKIVIDVPMPIIENDSMFFHGFLLSQAGDTLTQFTYGDIIECTTPTGGLLSWPSRPGTNNKTYRDEHLDYQIRFENTTNDDVKYAEVIIDLDPNIDISSILIKESSHPVKTYLQNENLHFIFEDIDLSGKGLNNTKNAYLSFTCAFKKDIIDGTQIKNTAFISLGSNPIFQTNESINTIVSREPCFAEEQNITLCPGESYTTAQNIYSEVGTYYENIQGISGCDTLRTINLSFHTLPTDTISQFENIMITTALGNQYFWYNCSTDELVETTLEPLSTINENGSYYVIVEGEFCNYKTPCYDFIISSTTDFLQNDIKIFPNPSNQFITVKTALDIENIIIRNIMGQVVYIQNRNATNIDLNDLSKGIFLLEIKTQKGIFISKLIKQ